MTVLCFICTLFCAIPSVSAEADSRNVWPDGSRIDRWFYNEDPCIPRQETHEFFITDYGAVADSTLLQTAAIQAAIDAAAVSGGTVVIPEGVWLTSSLFFKPGTHLRIDKGAVLKGSDDVSDYAVAQKVHIEGVIQPYIAAVVNAYGVDGFSITGEGKMDGNGLRYWRDFWKRREVNRKCTNIEALRPRLVYVANSSDIHFEGVTFRNSGFWTMHLYKCNRVRFKNVGIFAPMAPVKAPSSDGIDLDACTDVHITGCRISVNDDIIALKGGKGPWADTDPDNGTNANILVEKCRFGHGPGVITFGSECVGGRNVILRDSEVHGATRLLCLKMRPDTPQRYEYVLVENITGEVRWFLHIHPWTQFFDLKGREDVPMSYAEHIAMRRCRMTCSKALEVVENPEQYKLSDIVVEDNEITETEKVGGLLSADLVFVIERPSAPGKSGMSDAIIEATGAGEDSATHVGIIEVSDEGTFVIDAAPRNGVSRRSLQDFKDELVRSGDSRCVVMRLKTPVDAGQVIRRAMKYIGRPYDCRFLPDNEEFYCSEFVQLCFLDADGNHIFGSRPMNFKNEDGEYPEFWKSLFESLDSPIPQGVPGTNPTDMMHSESLMRVDTDL